MYLTDSSYANITEDTGNTSSTDDEFCFDKKKRMRKRKERTPREKYPEIAIQPKFDKNIFASHKHTNCNSSTIGKNESLFQQSRNTVKKVGGSYRSLSSKNQKM